MKQIIILILTYSFPLPSGMTVAISVTVLIPPPAATVVVPGPVPVAVTVPLVLVCVGTLTGGVDLGLSSFKHLSLFPFPLTVIKSLDPPVPNFPPSNAARMKDVPARTLVSQVQELIEGEVVNMNGWPPGMTPIIRTGDTAVASQLICRDVHCCSASAEHQDVWMGIRGKTYSDFSGVEIESVYHQR